MSELMEQKATGGFVFPTESRALSVFTSFAHIFRVLWRNRKSRVGLVLLGIFLFLAIFGPLLTPYDPNTARYGTMALPSLRHPLGTTQAGADVLSRLIVGTRITFIVTLSVGALSTLCAMIIGITAGYVGGVVDDVLNFLTNVFLVLPGLPLLIVLASYAPSKGIWMIIFIISFTGWPWGARVLRSQVMTLRTRDFVTGAVLAGDSIPRILSREILPNMISLVAANFFSTALAGLLAAVGLQFLGFGSPSLISWGTMLYWAQNSGALLDGQWAWIMAPGLCIALLGTTMILLNFGVDELSNPRLQEE